MTCVAALAATSAGTLLPALSTPAGAATGDATVSVASPVVEIHDGAVAQVDVRLDVAGGSALASDVTVTWATGTGTARAGQDYAPASGTLTFAAGSPSGSIKSIFLPTTVSNAGRTAATIPITLATTTAGVTVSTQQPTVVIDAHDLPYLDSRLPVKARVADLVSRMTLADKVGQMTQAERAQVDKTPAQIATYRLGSLLSGGGSTPAENTPAAWADMIDRYQSYARTTSLQIPLIYGIDSVHGNGNLKGATLFPHNIGLGATRDPALVRDVEHVTAVETRAIGIPWVFAPCLCVARDDRWGRTYESFGEDPALVEAMETSIDGFQGNGRSDLARTDRVLATAKHFAGDGLTTYGTGHDPQASDPTAHASDYPIDQGIDQVDHATFNRLALAPYVPAVQKHHVGSVMPSYSSVDWTEDGLGNPIKMHANKALIQGWLKNRTGFDGFVISDYHGIDQIPGDRASDVRTWVNAGGDMAMEPDDYASFESTLVSEVGAKRVSMSRINDAVSRILTKKFQLGLLEHPFADRTLQSSIGSTTDRAVARRAAAESQVLLKNSGGALPLSRKAKVYVAGRNADDLGNQNGGWTITWQGQPGTYTTGTTILQGMRQVAPGATITYSKDASAPMTGSDVGVVVVGETPYSEGFGDVGGPRWAYDPVDKGKPREPKTLTLKDEDTATIDKVCSTLPICVVLVVSGRPQVLTDQLPKVDALVSSSLPGTEGEGVADVLFGVRPFTGQLSQSWPRSADQEPINVGDANYAPLFPFGFGLTTDRTRTRYAELLGDVQANGRGALNARISTLLRTARAGTENDVVAGLRTLVEQKVSDSATGVPASAADLIARSDVALLRGNRARAVSLLLTAGGWTTTSS